MRGLRAALIFSTLLLLAACGSAEMAEPEALGKPQAAEAFEIMLPAKTARPVKSMAAQTPSLAALPETIAQEDSSPNVVAARIVAVGDIMMMNHQIRAAKTPGGYDFFPAFEHIAHYVGTADIAIANLETTVAGEELGYSLSGELQEDGTKSLSYFNAPIELLDALGQAGFNVLTTANNHTLDKGREGLIKTIENVRQKGFVQTGTFLSGDEKRYAIVEAGGMSVGILAYTSGTNKNSGGMGSKELREKVNILDKKRVLSDIRDARDEGAEFIVLCLHWGVEFSAEPAPDQKRLARELVDAGADVIVGAHPHVLQPIELIEAGGRRGIVAYSMGNFISNMAGDEHIRGMMLIIDIEKQGGDIQVRASYLPTLCKSVSGQRSVLAASPSAIQAMPGSLSGLFGELNKAYEKTTAIIGREPLRPVA